MANIVISTTQSQDARIKAAVGAYLGLGRDADVGEIKQQMISHIQQIVHDQERRGVIEAIRFGSMEPT